MGSWEVGQLLGKGKYGTVWEINQANGTKRLALKHLEMATEDDVEKELATGERMHHSQWHATKIHPPASQPEPNPYKDKYLIGKFTRFIITSPIADSGTLEKFLRGPRPTDEVLIRMIGCLIIGLASLHDAGIWHYDIHAQNILIHKGAPLYNDFGLSNHFLLSGDSINNSDEFFEQWDRDNIDESGHIITSTQAAKQVALGSGPEKDVFSLGAALIDILAVLTKDAELDSYREMKASRSTKILQEESNDKVRKTLDRLRRDSKHPYFMTIVRSMLDRNPKTRPTAAQVALKLFDSNAPPNSNCLNCSMWYLRHNESIS